MRNGILVRKTGHFTDKIKKLDINHHIKVRKYETYSNVSRVF